MRRLMIFIHGKGGNIKEIEHYKPIFKDYDVIGFDYQSNYPWEAEIEFSNFFDTYSNNYDYIIIVANSIGAYFSLCSLYNKKIDKVFFISPIVNMEKLINNMMIQANVSTDELFNKKEIKTNFGETLSWKYLCYAKEQKIEWNIQTFILYGENDNLTSIDTIRDFQKQINASLTIMKGGDHWFHTEEQMEFLDNWIKSFL